MKHFTFKSSSIRHGTKTILLSLFLLISLQSFSQSLESDRLALVDLYNATNGDHWINRTGWAIPGKPGDNPCGWYGITCEGGRVMMIGMGENNLAGALPESFSSMTALKYLYLENNHLSGQIPSSIGRLTNLHHLALGTNPDLGGKIPPSIANLHLLELLNLGLTKITGNIPAELGALTELKSLGLAECRLYGPIPKELGNLSQLKLLFLERNQLSGSIPSELGNAKSLASITLNNNQLTGQIPSSINNLTKLAYFTLELNNLSGPLPNLSEIPPSCEINISFNRFTYEGIESNITKLDYYYLQKMFLLSDEGGVLKADVGGSAGNNTYRWYKNGVLTATNNGTDSFVTIGNGTYRAEVSNSKVSSLLLVSEDYIIGPDNLESDRQALLSFYREGRGWEWAKSSGWSSFGNVGDNPCGWFGVSCAEGRVTGLNLDDNNLTGTITPNIKNLKKLKHFGAGTNSLWGEIPSSIGELNLLETIQLYDNRLSGFLPSSFANLANLKILFIWNNQIGGPIPPTIENLHLLERLELSSNRFTGNIPKEMGDLSNLKFLNISNNALIGSIPNQMANLARLQHLNLAINQLSGQIPNELGQLNQLEYLGLNRNQLSGPIPATLTNLPQLQSIQLGFNFLSGSIPQSIGNLGNLTSLDLSRNKLTGNLPSSLGNLTYLQTANLDHNNFSGTIPSEIGNLKQMRQLMLEYNNLTGSLPEGVANWTKLSRLSIDHNHLDGTIPKLTQVPESAYVAVNDNDLTFDSFEPNTSKIDVYSPQAKIPIHASGNSLYVDAGGKAANNGFLWYKNDVLVTTLFDTTAFTMTGSGKYRVEVTNNVASNLKLVSEDFIQSNSPPGQLVNFAGKRSGESNLLNWSTTAEFNNSGFEVERRGSTGKFEKIGFVDGKGESNTLVNYQFVDEKPLSWSYYRLRQIDFDGNSTTSQIVEVSSDGNTLRLYPNPTKDILTIESLGSGKSIEIYNLKGTRIKELPVTDIQTISTSTWPIGTYIIRHGDKAVKVVVEK